MNCGHARRLFGAYWDDEITLAERDWLESHFSACDRCRHEYESFARTVELVGSLPRAEVTPGLAERALARARRATPARDELPVSVTPRWVPATATAALVLIALATTLQWIGMTPRGRIAAVPESRVQQPVLVARPAPSVSSVTAGTGAKKAEPAVSSAVAAAVVDSLFDRSDDIEFVLDPVSLRKGRAHTQLKVNPDVQGAKAVISF